MDIDAEGLVRKLRADLRARIELYRDALENEQPIEKAAVLRGKIKEARAMLDDLKKMAKDRDIDDTDA